MPTASRPKNSTRNRTISMTRYPSPASEASSGEGEEKWERSSRPPVIASASEAIQPHCRQNLDGFVALLLAMTGLNCFMIWPTLPSVRVQRHSAAWTGLMRRNVADGHGFWIERKEVAIEADQIPSGHQKRAGRHRGRIKPHRKLQI